MEVAQLLITAMVPIALLVLGVVTNRSLSRYESRQAANQKLVEKRIEIYDRMAGDINTLFCFCRKVGLYRDKPPIEMIEVKRRLDRAAHTHRPFFDEAHFLRYQEFMDVCFLTHTGAGSFAKLRVDPADYRQEYGTWEKEWDAAFVSDAADRSSRETVTSRHDALLTSFAVQMGTQRTEST